MSFAVDPADLAPYGITRDHQTGPSYQPLMPLSEINPLFSYSNFAHSIPYERLPISLQKRSNACPRWDTAISAATHAQLIPAFSLATKMLQHSAWFAYVIRNADIATYSIDGSNQEAFTLPGLPFSNAQRQTISQQLATLAAGQVRFVTGYSAKQLGASGESCRLQTTWTIPPRTFFGRHRTQRMRPSDAGGRYLVSLPREAFDLLESPAWLCMNESARLRFQFLMALTLVHETMHLLYYMRHLDAVLGTMPPSLRFEPHFCADAPLSRAGSELGNAWEVFFFGGVMEIPFDGPFIGSDGGPGQPSGFSYDFDEYGQVRYRLPSLTQQWRDLDAEIEEMHSEALSPWNSVAKHVVVSLSTEQFFDPARWAHFEWILSFIPSGLPLPGWEAFTRKGAGNGSVVESPFQLRFAPIRYQQTILGDRSEGIDDRNDGPEGRGEFTVQYDKMLKMCYDGEFHRLPGDKSSSIGTKTVSKAGR